MTSDLCPRCLHRAALTGPPGERQCRRCGWREETGEERGRLGESQEEDEGMLVEEMRTELDRLRRENARLRAWGEELRRRKKDLEKIALFACEAAVWDLAGLFEADVTQFEAEVAAVGTALERLDLETRRVLAGH